MPHNVMGCTYPTSYEIMLLQQELFPRYTDGRVGFDILPFAQTDSAEIVFQQPDIFRGMQRWRGLDQPTSVIDPFNPYGKICKARPGFWGEHDRITEEFLTMAAQPGTCNAPLDLTEHVTWLTNRLLERRYNRVEFNIWQALVYGTYTAMNEAGQIVFQQSYNIKHLAAGIPWSDRENSTPLADFRAIQLLSRGSSSSFGSCATAYMNRVTANCLFANTNETDVGRVGLSACCSFMSLEQVNQQFAAQGLPQIAIYDEGYVDDNGNFFPYIPDGKVVIVGCRPGNVPIGHYWLTRNAVGCVVDSGFWTKIIDTCDREVQRSIILADGHNGGAAIEYPSAIITLETGCTANDVIVTP